MKKAVEAEYFLISHMNFTKYIKEKIGFNTIWHILALFFTSRIILTIIGVLSRRLLEPFHAKEYVWVYSKYLFLDIWGVWDSGWYMDIATNSYSPVISTDLTALGQANYVFFPLYPVLVRMFDVIIGNIFIAGLILSNLFLLASLFIIYKLTELDYDKKTAFNSVLFLTVYPVSFILSGFFSESLFLFLTLACFYAARKKEWLICGVLGFFASFTRSIGFLIFIPMLYEYLKDKGFEFRRIRLDIICLFLIPLGCAVFIIYLYFLTGDFFTFIKMQMGGWRHSFSNPMFSINPMFNYLLMFFSFAPGGIVNFIITTISIILITAMFINKRFPRSYTIYSLLFITIPLMAGANWLSIARYTSVIFPQFMILGILSKNTIFKNIYLFYSLLFLGFLMVFWSNGFYVII